MEYKLNIELYVSVLTIATLALKCSYIICLSMMSGCQCVTVSNNPGLKSMKMCAANRKAFCDFC